MSLFLSLYGMAWTAAMPFLRRNKRLADGFIDRLAPQSWPWGEGVTRPEGPVLWIQAASGGEAGLVAQLVLYLEKKNPRGSHLTLLATTYTRQGLDVLEKIPSSCRLTVVPRYFPLDKPWIMSKAIEAARPDCIALLETELWPGLMSAAKLKGIPFLVLNGRMTGKSFSGYTWLMRFWKIHRPSAVLAVSQLDADRFGQLFGHDLVSIMPNIKFDSVKAQAEVMEGAKRAGIPPERAIITLASVRQEEEKLLQPVIERLMQSSINGQPICTIVAPRHMHRVGAWQKLFPKEAAKFSQNQSGKSLIIWDVFGRLKELYAMSDATFVGGSLAPLGGQNFLEALAQGIRPVIGPHWKNFHWVGHEVIDEGLVEQIAGLGELGAKLTSLAESRLLSGRVEDRAKVRQTFLSWLETRTGGTAQAAALISHTLGLASSDEIYI